MSTNDIVTESHKYKLELAIAEVLAAARTWAADHHAYGDDYGDACAWQELDSVEDALAVAVTRFAALADAMDDADYPDDPVPGGQFLDPLAAKPPSVPVPLAWLGTPEKKGEGK